jgi:hypothetical protein
MIVASVLLALPFTASIAPASTPVALVPQEADEVGQKITDAGTDVAKLLELAKSYQTAENDEAAKKVFERVVELDPEHEEAHKALRHHHYDGKWFKSYAELSKYRREETERMKAQGLARLGDEWVPIADLPYRKMGWTQEDGKWIHPGKAARAKDESEKAAAGWKQQADLVWVAPEEQARWSENLWKCGDQWLAQAEADAYHADLGRWWTLPGQHFVTYSTCDYETVRWINWYADKTYPSLVRLFGIEPSEPPTIVVLKSLDQYNKFATGDQAAQFPPSEIDGFSSLHHAFFAESFFDVSLTPPEYKGSGAAFWDKTNPSLEPWGHFAVRHAAGLSYAEAIDPSWVAVSDFLGGGQPATAPFWAEKRIPRWLHYGAASYVERYMPNEDDKEAPWAWREWAIGELKKGGKLDELDRIFAFPLDLNQIEASTRLIHEAGLLVSFILDGGCKSVVQAHQALLDCLRTSKGVPEAVVELQEVLKQHQRELEEFAGI